MTKSARRTFEKFQIFQKEGCEGEPCLGTVPQIRIGTEWNLYTDTVMEYNGILYAVIDSDMIENETGTVRFEISASDIIVGEME